ncbi:MAG: DAK2 domain-containing protein [Clostridiales bacterium]|nr:DAK2 domain-containing protein [Clostridiales bacterium]
MQKSINGASLRKMFVGGVALLDQNKKLVDALNVFPVPDGDTGTNMFLTLKSAVTEVNNCIGNNATDLCEAFSKGALRGARGNSGVITSQIVKGFCSVLAESKELNTKAMAKAITEGCKIAYKAVTVPKEGTILTVIRGMSEAANDMAKKTSDLEEFLKGVLDRGEEVLQQTPEMLPVLKKAGVVDAGGRGIIVVFTGFYRALKGEDFDFVFADSKPVQTADDVVADYSNLAEIEFGYCTEYMIINMNKKTTEADIEKLKEKLIKIGDSVLCLGDLNLVKVHVHTNTPNVALGYALELGELYNLKIENMREQNRELMRQAQKQNPVELKENGMIAVAPGSGIAELMRELTIDNIIEGGQTMNPSANDIAEAADKVPAKNIYVFPNNKNIILACEQAKDLTSKNLIVIPTRSVPEGITAALCFNPDGDVEENTQAMMEAMKTVKSASVTYAVRATHVDGFDLNIGEIIGLDEKSIKAKGTSIGDTTKDLISKMLTPDTSTITLFYGSDVKPVEADLLQQELSAKYPNIEVSAIYGGQPVYYYIISIE